MSSPRIALITGAAGGIGSAIARKLSSEGFIVLCIDKNEKSLLSVTNGINNSHPYALDITSKKQVENLYSQLSEADLLPTHLVNAAGVFFTHDFLTLSEEEFDLIIDVNVKAIFLMCQTFLPHFIENKSGNIVNISSTAGLRGGRERAIYSASKAAVISLTRSLTVDFGKLGIRANTICPGLIDTPMADWITSQPEALHAWEKTVAAQRIGTAEDIANTVLFLAQDSSSYMYGSTIVVDGGGTA